MKIFSSVLSREDDWRKAAEIICQKINSELGGKSCDLAVFFLSEGYNDMDPEKLSAMLSEKLACGTLIGCNASGIIGRELEIEMEPAISVLAMHLDGADIHPFSLSAALADSLKEPEDLSEKINIDPSLKPNFICFADHMSCDVEEFLRILNNAYNGSLTIGGLASGASLGVPNWLSLNGEIFGDGIVGVGLTGNVKFDVIVSQGCRPIGETFVITKADAHILYELASRPATEVLQDVFDKLSPADKDLARHSIFCGLVINEQQHKFKRGDFLIRNLLGMDAAKGTLMIGAMLKTGQTFQFQLRDAHTSSEDLKILLGDGSGSAGRQEYSSHGGVLVSCCGRGKGLYGEPNHDIKIIQDIKGPLPIVGFFANGEIGPVGAKNYLHGYTSSLVIIK